eukprot:scaffold27883_cov65-Cyclotella_meneghiniana.AAC.2
MPSSTLDKDGMPLKDPYIVLGISTNATETEIKRAYRQQALKLHPDKQSDTLTESQRLALDKQFHEVKDARAFLLDAEHAEARRKYAANLASERMRHAEEERRERTMSSRRKRMRDELSTREKMAKMASSGSKQTTSEDRFDVERLRREGERLREEYSRREAEVDAERRHKMAVDRATQKLQKEDRQVRLKWSRKKIVGGVHTKQSLTAIMKDFGQVEEVELLGSKGNAALITFTHESSCKPCVDAYKTSETMRATLVGRRKHHDDNIHESESDNFPVTSSRQDTETLEERKLRQAAERERLMRKMELEEQGGGVSSEKVEACHDQTDKAVHKQKKSTFPPDFPAKYADSMPPIEIVEKYEKLLFDRIDKLDSNR